MNPHKTMAVNKTKIKRRLAERDGLVCGICGNELDSLREATIDHIIPSAIGGTNEQRNLRLAHRRCNNRHGAWFGHALRRGEVTGIKEQAPLARLEEGA